MDRETQPLIFDGHNDVLLRLFSEGGVKAAPAFLEGRGGHVDLPRAKKGGLGGGFFAIYVPSPDDRADQYAEMCAASYDLPLPPPLEQGRSLSAAIEQAAILLRLEQLEALKICRSVADIRNCLSGGTLAAIVHLEGAEAIDPDLHVLDVLHAAGLRSLGPVWSRPTIFGHGVPFAFPAGPDRGPGLTDAGRRLVRRCNELGIMIDLSHMNAAGFRDVARLSNAPLVATHSNVHAICPHARNLTDSQLAMIAESDGMVGLNFAAAFLRADGQMRADVPLETVLRHLDYLIAHLGEDRVGFGSDFDGALMPAKIGDAAGLPALRRAMRAHGYGEGLIEKLCYRNWLRVLEKTWEQQQ